MTTKETLIKARELYAAAPSHAPATAVPEYGTYCVITALLQVGGPYSAPADAILAAAGASELVDWNADHSTEEVLAVFDKAIREAT